MSFLALLADQAAHPLDLQQLEPGPFLDAMVASFRGDTAQLVEHIRRLIE